jgi:hypothetical protein
VRTQVWQAQGWYYDPYSRHADRWYSVGRPTDLVRDDGIETRDAPPAGEPLFPLIPAEGAEGQEPAGGGLTSRPAPRTWRRRSLWPPYLLTLACTGFYVLMALIALAMNGFDGASYTDPGWLQAGIIGVLVLCSAATGLLIAGVFDPVLWRTMALALWTVFPLVVGWSALTMMMFGNA